MLEPSPSLQNSPSCLSSSMKAEAYYHTSLGAYFLGHSEELLASPAFGSLRGRVQLILTSPPFALNNKKRYDNKQGDEYKEWLSQYALLFRDLLADNGSLVMELGNAWEPGLPVMSTLALESLLEFRRQGGFYLCQQFVANNPARLPSPAQWVTVKRTRVTDSFTHIWWMAKTPHPKADNRRVLRPYSPSMRRLLRRGSYNTGSRPSEHVIGSTSFLRDHGGAIPHNLLALEDDPTALESAIALYGEGAVDDARDALAWLCGLSNVADLPNTASKDPYLAYCRDHGLRPHPARMHPGIPSFFVQFVTEPGDLVMDPFAGSNTTGAIAEKLGRGWMSFDPVEEYAAGSKSRFVLPD